ncbi:MAG TPA: hypothetical protein DEP42_05145 [Ruminococcaceae bacterium]|nr:hypothetical protein [Oscillospiraceae bacterium]
MMDKKFVTTAFEIPGYSIDDSFGIVRGITVRSRSLIGIMGAGFQQMVGGKITIYIKMCEQTREEAFQEMLKHATEISPDANGIIGVRYDANDVAPGIAEVICYGTAVHLTRK